MTTFILICIWGVLIYFIALHVTYFLLVLIGAGQIRKYNREITFSEFDRIAKSELSMPVSVIVPAFNEEKIIIGTIENALKLNYPKHEVIVMDDGSTDQTIPVLIERFGLLRIDKHGSQRIPSKEVLAVYESPEHPNLVVATKENGRRADAINAAAALARYPLLCVIDADCVIESDGLLHMARPFLKDSRVAVSSGVVRPSNGLVLVHGEILRRGLPRTLLGMSQEVEYVRSFQWARTGLSRLQSMLSISGALLLVRKKVFEAVGGSWPAAITDDIDLSIRLNKHLHDRRNDEHSRIVFTPDAVCYTEVPEKYGLYASQRNRWQRGTLQALLRNWKMIFNPRYGMSGLFGMPFFIIFEAGAVFVELLAYVLIAVTLILGIASIQEILVLLLLAYSLNLFLTLAAVLLTEASRLRAASWKDFWKMIAAVFLENLGFHQWHLIHRVIGTIQYILFRRRDLGAQMERILPTPKPV
jgi:cellulose synthase/poly-beta-1,6-N-acetylglucosamine synthase-like glycosyltransferase